MTAFPDPRVYTDVAALTTALADALLDAANAAITARGVFHLVLAGGSTPRSLYAELARRQAGDARWHIAYGDERCLPTGHPDRNSTLSESAWLAASAIPPSQRLPIPAELGPDAGAVIYSDRLANTPDFDVVLLGIGEDGHTASLFPGHVWNGSDALAVRDAPKPPPDRVSLSAERLGRSAQVWFVVTGAGKRDALARWQKGERLPAAAVSGRAATLLWLDAAASAH